MRGWEMIKGEGERRGGGVRKEGGFRRGGGVRKGGVRRKILRYSTICSQNFRA